MARRHRAEGPLAIASGSVRRLVTRTLDALGITDWFAAIVAAEDTARHKPEPDVFLEAARRLGAEPPALHRLRGHRHRPRGRAPRRDERRSTFARSFELRRRPSPSSSTGGRTDNRVQAVWLPPVLCSRNTVSVFTLYGRGFPRQGEPMPQTGRSLWWSASLIFLSLAGCGEPLPDSPVSTKSALTAPRSYLVSFTGGDIPADADALVKAAGGHIAARYPNIGAVLARSTRASFAPTLRLSTGIAAVGAVTAASTKLTPMKPTGHRPTPKTPPHASGGDPLSFRQWDMDQIHAPQAHGITAGSKSVLVGFVDSGVDITHPDLAGQVNASASASCVGGVPDTVTGHLGQRRHRARHASPPASSPPRRTASASSAWRRAFRLAMVKVLIDDFSDPNAGLVFPDAFVCGIDWAHRPRRVRAPQRQPDDRSVHRAHRRHLLQRPSGPGGDRPDRAPSHPWSPRRTT